MVPTNQQEWWTEYAEIKESVKDYISGKVSSILSNDYAKSKLHPDLWKVFEVSPLLSIHEVMDALENVKSPILYHLLHSIWEDAPDSPSIRQLPHWGRFCDLLSEGHDILFPEPT
jgi:hypothetical protein